MQRDPLDSQGNRLYGFRPEVLDEYDRLLPEITAPPKGFDDTQTFYEGTKSAIQVQEEFLEETPLYESIDYALHDNPLTKEDVVSIMQAREINSYTPDKVNVPREVEENGTKRHWEHLLTTLPRDAKISFAKGLAIIDMEMRTEEGLKNNGTMVMDLRNATENDGFRIVNFFQSGQNGTLAPTKIFEREDIEVRFKEQYMFVRWWSKLLRKTTRGSAGVVNGKNRINIHQLYEEHSTDSSVHPYYTDIPVFFHEMSHVKDVHKRSFSQDERRVYLSAYMIDKYLPLAASVTTLSAIMGTAFPWTLLFTGGLVTIDRILHKMSRDPNTDVGKAFLKKWKGETEARFSQKIASDLMVANGFVADRRTHKNILDIYQPNTWRYVDEYYREAEKALKKRLPQPAPQPAAINFSLQQ